MARLTLLSAGTLRSAAFLCLTISSTSGFTSPSSRQTAIRTPSSALFATSSPDIVVISPPGGIGEITSIESALLGGSVRWFVVSAPQQQQQQLQQLQSSQQSSPAQVALTAETLSAIERAGGSIELAGATADTLLIDDGSSSTSSSSAVATWCQGAKAILCTYDGIEEEKRRVDRVKTAEERGLGNEENMISSGIRVAAREAVGVASRGVVKVAVLGAGEEMDLGDSKEEKNKKGGGLLGGLFGGNKVEIPDTIGEAMGGALVIRHGELFGASASSPESSPFIGGPRRDPVIRDMYTMRSIRIDPTISISGNILSGGGSKSNRLSVGAAATRLGLGKIGIPSKLTNAVDVSISSFAGTEVPTEEEWQAEFGRVLDMLASPSGGATLFSAEFSSVPNTKRLAEWIATKWAPAILRSYDIAGTRVGARPVYAIQKDDNTVEIVWQELVNFNPVTSGRMIIQVADTGLTALRGAGDAAAGFGSVSMKPLPGEDILVRRLGDAASQAVEKGLAVKPKIAVKEAPKPVETKPVAAVVSTPAVTEPAPASSDAGPRSAGARRSSERSRGRRKAAPSSDE